MIETQKVRLLRLQIGPSFSTPTKYVVTQFPPYLLTASTYSECDWGDVTAVKTIQLSDEQHRALSKQLELALTSYPMKDEVFDNDGTIWFLDSTLYQHVMVTAWSPDRDSENRGYSELIKLREQIEASMEVPDA